MNVSIKCRFLCKAGMVDTFFLFFIQGDFLLFPYRAMNFFQGKNNREGLKVVPNDSVSRGDHVELLFSKIG